MIDTKLLQQIVEQLEWSSDRQGPGSYMGANDSDLFPACPECGGLEKPAPGHFIESAVGHRSGCKIALALGRPTVVEEGQTGRLSI